MRLRALFKRTFQPIFFVHIPKTGGTSFRYAAAKYFGKSQVSYDYGVDSKTTTLDVRQCIYEDDDPLKFFQCINKQSLLTGHVKAVKYAPIFDASRMAVFLRDPVERLVSEYKHKVRHGAYNGDFGEFAREERHMNSQSRILNGVPIESMAFIGITEDYASSIKLFNKTFSAKLPMLKENVANEDRFEISKKLLDEVRSLNEKDIQLYQSARDIFLLRCALIERGLPPYSFKVTRGKGKRITGWIVNPQVLDSVELVMKNASQGVSYHRSSKFDKGLFWLFSSMKGCVAFDFAKENESDQIDIYVEKDDVKFNLLTRTIC